MSTSLFEGLIRSQDSTWGDYDPADAAWARAIMSNAAHIADESAQVIANWRVSSRYIIRNANAALNELGVVARTYPIWSSQPFPLRFRADGSSYRVRVRVRARLDSAGTNILRIALRTQGGALGAVGASDTTSIAYTMSSTTEAWLTGGTGGDGDGNIYLPNASPAIVDRATIDELGGDATVVRETLARITIFGSPIGSSPVAIRLYGVHAAEYVGT